MTWEEFHDLFMGKFFSTSTRREKAWEFMELKQGTMIVHEYVAKFTELARFIDDYVATYMTKVRKFEEGLKLSIWDKTVGFLLQDMDLMVKTTMVIEREVDDARNIRDACVKDKRRESQPLLLAQERNKGVLLHKGFKDRAAAIKAKARLDHPKVGDISGSLSSQCKEHVSIATSLDT